MLVRICKQLGLSKVSLSGWLTSTGNDHLSPASVVLGSNPSYDPTCGSYQGSGLMTLRVTRDFGSSGLSKPIYAYFKVTIL